MSTESCGRCGATAPDALLRNVSLHVDGSEVDAQTICPDCFSDWIAHYQSQMAGDMPGADEPAADPAESDDAALDQAVRAAQQHVENEEPRATNATPPGRQREESVERAGGDEIREVGSGSTTDGGVDERSSSANQKSPISGDVDVDLGGSADVAEDEEEDDGGLLPG